MGMTDRQLDILLQRIVRDLERAEDEILSKYQGKSTNLEILRKDLEDQLKRP